MIDSFRLLRAEVKRLNALAKKYRRALEDIELDPQANPQEVAKKALAEND